MNNNIVDERWKTTRNQLNEFLKEYQDINKLTQDKLQDLFNSLNITYDDLNKVISKVEKERLKRKVKEWENLGVFTGYFKYRVNELMKGNIFYKDLIEILLYGLLIEEKQALSNNISTVFQLVILDCFNIGRKDLGKKKVNSLSKEIDKTIFNTLIGGITWFDYVDSLVLTNMQEIQKRYLIELQQNKESNIYDDVWQKTLEIQRNRLISINDDKYSGGLDEYATAYGNLAYLESGGIENQQVKFISDKCDNVTDMCSYMDGMIFNTKTRNIFKRPMGKTKKDLLIQEVDIIGLVTGINLPPISEHFHWCHSILTYNLEINNIWEYSIIDRNKFNSAKGTYVEHIDMKRVNEKLIEYEHKIKNEEIEHMYVILPNGNVFKFVGAKDNVKADGIDLYGAIVTHNHTSKHNIHTLSNLDKMDFKNNEISRYRGIDSKYTFEINRDIKFREDMPTLDTQYEDDDLGYHINNISDSYKDGYGYKRWKNNE